MHKGYTIPYFIKFFSDIPPSKWICDSLTNAEQLNTGCQYQFKACAMGFAGAHTVKETVEKDWNGDKVTVYREGKATTPKRAKVLSKLLGNIVEAVNDNSRGEYSELGKTPRARILKALRLRKKFGKDWQKHL